MMFYLFRY